MESVTTHRKLIDIQTPAFEALQQEAARKNISLKRYIENLLDQEAAGIRLRQRELNPGVLRLLGSAIPKDRSIAEIDDDRLRYILSK